MNPWAYNLCLIQWDVFGSLTFRDRFPRSKRFNAVWRLMRYCAKKTGTDYRKMLVCVRTERGELTGRFHAHCLIGGINATNIKTTCFVLRQQWKNLTGSLSIISPYDRAQAGPAYIAKCLTDGQVYELGKFGGDEIIVSASFRRAVRAQCLRGEIVLEPPHRCVEDGHQAETLPA